MDSDLNIDELEHRCLELQSSYDIVPLRCKLGYSIIHSDFLNTPDFSVILSDTDKTKLDEINKAEESVNPSSWKAFLASQPAETITCVDEPGKAVKVTDHLECSLCKLQFPDFQFYLLHAFGRMHTQRIRRNAIRERKSGFSSAWDRLIQILSQAQIRLDFVGFQYWNVPVGKIMVRMYIGDYKFQSTGHNIKETRLQVIDKAAEFSEVNLSLDGGFRKVQYSYIPDIERAPVLIDPVASEKLMVIRAPQNDDPSISTELIVMSLLDYIGCRISKEEKSRYVKHMKNTARNSILLSTVAYCDVCDNRIPNDLCEAHLYTRRHFECSLNLPTMRSLVEESLIRGVPIGELKNFYEISKTFELLTHAYRAPFELCDLQKRYCMYFCAFCKVSIRHDLDLERHLKLSNHARNMLTKGASSDEHTKNRELLKEHVRNLLIPIEHRQEFTSVHQLPEAIRDKLPLKQYTDDLIEKSIESAINDPDALIKRSIGRFENRSQITNIQHASKKRKRPGLVGLRNRGVSQSVIKRFRENAGHVLTGTAGIPNPIMNTRRYNSAKSRGPLGSFVGSPASRASMAIMASDSDNSIESHRMRAAEELRRRRNFSRLFADDSPIYDGVPSSPMPPPGRPYRSFGTPMSNSDRRLYDAFDDDDLGRPSITDRLRNSAGHYDTSVSSISRQRMPSSFTGSPWSASTMSHSTYYDFAPPHQQWGSGSTTRDDHLSAGQYMPPEYSSRYTGLPDVSGPYMPGASDRRYSALGGGHNPSVHHYRY